MTTGVQASASARSNLAESGDAAKSARKLAERRDFLGSMAIFLLLILCACLDRAAHLMPLFWVAPTMGLGVGFVYFTLRQRYRSPLATPLPAGAGKSRREALLNGIGQGGLGALMVAVAITAGLGVDLGSWLFHKHDLADYENDPQGFGFIRDLAKREFGKLLLLNSPGASWSSTVALSRVSSPASMNTDAGFCTLSISPATLRSGLAHGPEALRGLQFQGVLIHELAHCLDLSRDLWKNPGQPGSINALPPSAVGGVHDLESYLLAGRTSPTTGLWREAYADVFLVGYWRLRYPESAVKLVAGLQEKRASDGIAGDTDHATTCWIDVAMKLPPPDSLQGLVEWADTARRTSVCGAL